MRINEYNKGRSYAVRFDLVRKTNGYWTAFRGGEEVHFIEPITIEFLHGLQDGGCPVQGLPERRDNTLQGLIDRIAFVMGKVAA